MILHIDMDAFYASVEEQDNLSLVGGSAEGRGGVEAANYEARRSGVLSALAAARASATVAPENRRQTTLTHSCEFQARQAKCGCDANSSATLTIETLISTTCAFSCATTPDVS